MSINVKKCQKMSDLSKKMSKNVENVKKCQKCHQM